MNLSGGDTQWVRSELTQLVSREYQYLRQFYELLWRQPLAKRVKQGRAVDRLTFDAVTHRKRGVVKLHAPVNESRFRAGDLLRLSRNNPAGHGYEVTWYGEDDDWVGVVFYRPHQLKHFLTEASEGEWTLDESYVDLQGLYEKAFQALSESVIGRDQVVPILAGELKPEVDLAAFEQASASLSERSMNPTQQEAAAMALAAHPYALIQGPPGTGKTRTLAMIVRELVDRGERVLVTALTHRAIHEALNKVCGELSHDVVAKIGMPVYDPGLIAKDYASFKDCPLADAASGYVIGATPFTLWSRRLAEVAFDTVIVDESSQVTPPLAVMAMLKANRYVFVGDHQQLPPVMAHLPLSPVGDIDRPEVTSIFSRLRDHASSTLLETCYRMNAPLCEWSSAQFYQGRLQAADANAQRVLQWPGTTGSLSQAWRCSAASVVVLLEHDERFTESREEAEQVAKLVEEWQAGGQTLDDLGVVVPYRRQANRIRAFLRNRERFGSGAARQLTVDTVDRFQGSEREAMILPFTASDPVFIEEQAAFLLQPQRLNVAATRARSKRILLVAKSLVEVAERLADGGDEPASLFLTLIHQSETVHG